MATSTSAVPDRIFISYRREDAAYPASWLHERLAERFGQEQVFQDIDSIQLGDDFVEVITRAVGSCDVLLVLIGKRWLSSRDKHGRRLDDPEDFVRLEIEAALARDVRIIPILVGGARMPTAGELPPSLGMLARRQALELHASQFGADISRLIKVLDGALTEIHAQKAVEAATVVLPVHTGPAAGDDPGSGTGGASHPAAAPGRPPAESRGGAAAGQRKSLSRRVWVPGAAVAALALTLALVYVFGFSGTPHPHRPAGAVPPDRKSQSAPSAISGHLTGSLAAALHNPQYSSSTVAFGRGGTMLAVGGINTDQTRGATYVWDLATRKITATLTDPGGAGVDSVAFGPGSTTLAAGDDNGSTYLWNPATRTITATLTDPGGVGVDSVAFGPGGRTLAAGDINGSTYLWNLTTKTLTATLTDPGTSTVDSVTYGPGGRTLATGDDNGSTYLWNLATRTITATLTDPGHTAATSVAFGPGAKTLAVGGDNTDAGTGATYVWDLATRKITATLTNPGTIGVDSVAFGPGSTTLTAGDINGSTYLWNLATKTLTATLTAPGSSTVDSVAYGPDGTTLAIGDDSGSTYLWNIAGHTS